MSDSVFVRGLQVDTLIGVYDWEREQPRPLLLDITFGTDLRAAGRSDDVAQAIDYAQVCQQARQFAASARVQLLETFAEQLAAALLERWPAHWIELRVSKPGAVPGVEVGVTLRREAAR